MSSKVLVLNQDFRAITLCSMERAFILVFMRKAELVSDVAGEALRTTTKSFAKPSIIRLSKYIHVPYKNVELTRHNIFKRDGNCCAYCGSKQNLTIDHVMPKSRGGKSNWSNLVAACSRCNSKKGYFTPVEAGMPLRVVPHKPTFVNFLRKTFRGSKDDWMEYLA